MYISENQDCNWVYSNNMLLNVHLFGDAELFLQSFASGISLELLGTNSALFFFCFFLYATQIISKHLPITVGRVASVSFPLQMFSNLLAL